MIIITIQICLPFRKVSRLTIRRCRGILLLFDTRILDRYEIFSLTCYVNVWGRRIIYRKKKHLELFLSDLIWQIVPNFFNLQISTTSSSCHQRFAMRTSSAAVISSLHVVWYPGLYNKSHLVHGSFSGSPAGLQKEHILSTPAVALRK